ncbi:hypothetical protein ABET36_07215 [Caldifermentibacillus hisashii]|uniref:hypothetical protein n=1 Tax=Caldifermentibacillus hisashii TaxID=996558 RepID=UPI003D21BC1A
MDESKEYCPFCGADLQGPPIPKEIQHHYGATHGSRKIGIYSRKKIVSLNGNVRIAERNGSGSSEGEVRKASPFYLLKIEKKKNPCSVYSKRLMVLTFFW